MGDLYTEMMRHNDGDRATCRHCSGDIEWHGRWVHVRQGECAIAQPEES